MVRATSKPTDVAERVELALRQSEIRASLRGLDPLEVEMIYRTADPETRVAMESSPPTIRRARPDVLPTAAPLVRPELVAELAEARLAEQNPEAAARIAELSEIAAFVRERG